VEAVDRALALLAAFADGTPRLSLTELARRTGLWPSTLLRLAASLTRGGILVRGTDGLFRLGPATLRLGLLYRAGFDLAEPLRPVLAQLAERTAETAAFFVREGDARLCLFRHESDRPVRHAMREGDLLPLDRGAGGHVLRAFTDPPTRQLAAVRAAGLALSLGERDPEAAAMAAPVFGAGGFVGGLSVSGPIGRFGVARRPPLEAALREAAAALSRALGAG
jgi:DNA-binding IclR family transcriptional regulator